VPLGLGVRVRVSVYMSFRAVARSEVSPRGSAFSVRFRRLMVRVRDIYSPRAGARSRLE